MSAVAVNVPRPVPADRFDSSRPFLESCPPEALIYFLLNIGDGDAQLIVLPERARGGRRAIVVDAGSTKKLPALVEAAVDASILTEIKDDPYLFPLVIATHPHDDHISGIPEFVDRFKDIIRELWEPGYYHPTGAYIEMMRALEDADGAIQHTQPTSGTTRYIGRVRVQVLAPAIGIKNRFDTYGINLNNASIAIKLEFPASSVEWTGDKRQYVRLDEKRRRLLLGADAQTLSWAAAMNDFPQLEPSEFPAYKALRLALGSQPLRAEIFKVPHHGSKHGLNLELVEEVSPAWTLISSVGGGGRFNFPHLLMQEAVREARDPTSSSGAAHGEDWELGIHYTSAKDTDEEPLGTMALVIPPTGAIQMWRFGDRPRDPVDLQRGRRLRDR